jgi:hypothetical protein
MPYCQGFVNTWQYQAALKTRSNMVLAAAAMKLSALFQRIIDGAAPP